MNPIAIITGASTGIGAELAHVLAEQGYDLGLLARRSELLEALKNKIKKDIPSCEIVCAVCDVTKLDECQEIIKNMAEQLGGLDLFIANAGIGWQTPAWKQSWPVVRSILETNVMGTIASLEIAKDIMIKNKSGHLVGITSVAGFRGLPTSSGYSTSKVALTAYLESIRLDLKKSGIPVTAIHPGFIDTHMTKKNNYKMPFIMPAEKAAHLIWQAIRKKKSRYVFPWQMNVMIKLLRLMPDWLYDRLMSLYFTGGVFR